jgi:hypothetical protein
MVSLDSCLAMESQIACGDEKGAALPTKVDMFRGNTGPSVLSRRFSRKATMETEGTSTTDGSDGSESRHESDSLSDGALDVDSIPEEGANAFDCMPATACPFDFVQSVRVCPAFCEREVSRPEAWPAQDAAFQNEVMQPMPMPPMQPMQPMAPQGPQPMSMPPMQPMAPQGTQPMAMPQMPMQMMHQQMMPQSMGSYPQGGKIMVPVPVPMPFQMPFSMPNAAPPSVPVPPGFKLVKIPEPVPEQAPEKKIVSTKSSISNPASTERKIFVGGLNPSTTGQTLREYFSTFGPVMDAKVIREGEKSKGFGFVQFKDCIPAEVLEASAHIIDQRRCGVGPAFHRESSEEEVA